MSRNIAGIEPGPSDHQAVILTTRQPTTSLPEVGNFWLHILTPNINANH